MENIATIASAVIGLLGTLFGSVMAYRQWRRDKHDSLYHRFQEERLAAYRELWDVVEKMSIESRYQDLTNAQRSEMLRGVNSFMLLKGLFFEESDRRLVESYLDAATTIHKMIHSHGTDEDRESLMDTRAIMVTPEMRTHLAVYADTLKTALKHRASLIGRIRGILKVDK